LSDFGSGDQEAVRDLLPKVYDELRRLAGTHLAAERTGHTLQPTALVHEAYVRLAERPAASITDRAHFFRLASKVMRQILVDHARSRAAAKRGAGAERVTLSEAADMPSGSDIDLLELEDALDRLAGLSVTKARLVELRFFGGLTIEEAAATLDISRTQATREWRTARAWLADELDLEPGP
jgi:RNA polymerase sigma factor (TIGR02999 family)